MTTLTKPTVDDLARKLRALGGHWKNAQTAHGAGGKVHVTGLTHPDYAEKGLHTTGEKLKARLTKDSPLKTKPSAPVNKGAAYRDGYDEYAKTTKGPSRKNSVSGSAYDEYAANAKGPTRSQPKQDAPRTEADIAAEYAEEAAARKPKEAKVLPTAKEATAAAQLKPGDVKPRKPRKSRAKPKPEEN